MCCLNETEREGEAFSQRRSPHDPGGLPVVVEETDDGQEAADGGPREVGGQQEEGRRGETAGGPDGRQVEVRGVGQPFTAVHRAQA